uniref:Uncharacterized protein n=1 Tax=Romanomermis culicivorax TaxID=13658 RepID=A0A915JX07_ROMCU
MGVEAGGEKEPFGRVFAVQEQSILLSTILLLPNSGPTARATISHQFERRYDEGKSEKKCGYLSTQVRVRLRAAIFRKYSTVGSARDPDNAYWQQGYHNADSAQNLPGKKIRSFNPSFFGRVKLEALTGWSRDLPKELAEQSTTYREARDKILNYSATDCNLDMLKRNLLDIKQEPDEAATKFLKR